MTLQFFFFGRFGVSFLTFYDEIISGTGASYGNLPNKKEKNGLYSAFEMRSGVKESVCLVLLPVLFFSVVLLISKLIKPKIIGTLVYAAHFDGNTTI